MSEDRRNYTTYIENVINTLKDNKYSDEDIAKVVKRVDHVYNDIDYHFPRKGWKYLIKHFTPEIRRGDNVIFECLGDFSYMCVYDSENNEYTVTFTFINKKDVFDSDFKKYLVYNYFKEKYTYKNIKASSFKNAVVVAYNKNITDFPKIYRDKLGLELNTGFIRVKNMTSDPDYTSDIPSPDVCFKAPYENYKRIREQMMTKFNLDDKNIRFYIHKYFGILVIRRLDTYSVTFSFINPIDRYHLKHLKNQGDVKHLARYYLIQNLLTNTYTYQVSAPNSMYAAVSAYNNNRFNFPSCYHDNKLDVCVSLRKDIVC